MKIKGYSDNNNYKYLVPESLEDIEYVMTKECWVVEADTYSAQDYTAEDGESYFAIPYDIGKDSEEFDIVYDDEDKEIIMQPTRDILYFGKSEKDCFEWIKKNCKYSYENNFGVVIGCNFNKEEQEESWDKEDD